ncbi:biotin carboxyl carrier protein [Scopulibacillus daqui]|uniref:Biotin carboxyl carrier protein n=1 Tax=Scopulibacillus daqui TaxID=1469162 RepID=A0ABS2Q1U9_9BACL|nr:biotin/lipoyl-containing protein [Scopulibacillus daqui]MBM7646274.1 biotin carboxyl carrier protein [Scopulibacillus daqui]
MIIRELITHRWGNKELVTSPSFGTVEKVFVKDDMRVLEWEPLFIIRTENGSLEQIAVGVNGVINSVHVKEGDHVIPGMVMAFIKDDLLDSDIS